MRFEGELKTEFDDFLNKTLKERRESLNLGEFTIKGLRKDYIFIYFEERNLYKITKRSIYKVGVCFFLSYVLFKQTNEWNRKCQQKLQGRFASE